MEAFNSPFETPVFHYFRERIIKQTSKTFEHG